MGSTKENSFGTIFSIFEKRTERSVSTKKEKRTTKLLKLVSMVLICGAARQTDLQGHKRPLVRSLN